MRRRQKQAEPGMPDHLRAFSPADWPTPKDYAPCGHAPCAFWAAVAQWRETHDGNAGPLVLVDGPDVPLHDDDRSTQEP